MSLRAIYSELYIVSVVGALIIALCVMPAVSAGTQQSNPEPELVNIQVPNGNPEIIEVTYDTTLEIQGNSGDLETSYGLNAKTINNVTIINARIGDPKTSVVLVLSNPILPQDGSLDGALIYNASESDDILQAENGTAEVPSFTEQLTVTNNLEGPDLVEATTSVNNPERLRVTFDGPVEIVNVSQDAQSAFRLDAQTENNVSVISTNIITSRDKSVILLNLSAPVLPQDGDPIGSLSFNQTNTDDTLRHTDTGVAAENGNVVVSNELNGPNIASASVPMNSPETIAVTFDQSVEIIGSQGDLHESFELDEQASGNITVLSDTEVKNTNSSIVFLDISARITASNNNLSLSFSQTDSQDTLQGVSTSVAAENFAGENVANQLAQTESGSSEGNDDTGADSDDEDDKNGADSTGGDEADSDSADNGGADSDGAGDTESVGDEKNTTTDNNPSPRYGAPVTNSTVAVGGTNLVAITFDSREIQVIERTSLPESAPELPTNTELVYYTEISRPNTTTTGKISATLTFELNKNRVNATDSLIILSRDASGYQSLETEIGHVNTETIILRAETNSVTGEYAISETLNSNEQAKSAERSKTNNTTSERNTGVDVAAGGGASGNISREQTQLSARTQAGNTNSVPDAILGPIGLGIILLLLISASAGVLLYYRSKVEDTREKL